MVSPKRKLERGKQAQCLSSLRPFPPSPSQRTDSYANDIQLEKSFAAMSEVKNHQRYTITYLQIMGILKKRIFLVTKVVKNDHKRSKALSVFLIKSQVGGFITYLFCFMSQTVFSVLQR